eukprot:TRINITY_DN1280_c0_g1_i17.p1 TRINITY_DN1280_c0_g1~~TRINITY_DN1280_c0_g1_i17.p1  ORF type:complete len:511 (-),score=158.05 TRINITY_DN1280_c0_g1_i17:105-1544(-)
MDVGGTSDPYVKLTCMDQTARTKTIDKCLNPVWGDEFFFHVNREQASVLRMVLIDKDSVSDDIIGHAVVDLETVPVCQTNEHSPPIWYDCVDDSGVSQGKIFVAVSWQPRTRVLHGSQVKSKRASFSALNNIRSLVSKKKIRFQEDGFDLDLTYITENILAMGFPSESFEGLYRNSMTEVQRFFETYHRGHYKVYNLCSERAYTPDKFFKCERYGFDDHNCPNFPQLIQCVEDIHNFIEEDPQNVAAVHCKAGKGRTGLVICCYLVFSHISRNAEEALTLYGSLRTKNGKGVTIPSQRRYVKYFERWFEEYYLNDRSLPVIPPAYVLRRVRFTTVPNFDVGGGCDPYFKIIRGIDKKVTYNSKKKHGTTHYGKRVEFVDLEVEAPIRGDVKFAFYDYDRLSQDDKMFHCWISTYFIQDNYVCLTKNELDSAVKDTKNSNFDANFKVEFFFESRDFDHNQSEVDSDHEPDHKEEEEEPEN